MSQQLIVHRVYSTTFYSVSMIVSTLEIFEADSDL